MNYVAIIKYAFAFFPFISALFTMPFILSQYHKYGSISFLKSILIYLFIFYLICAYFLVILPLPKISEVAKMTTPRTQLIPFNFIMDFIHNTSFDITDISTYIKMVKETYFYVPFFNILLTLPFGAYLRYYFKCSMKKTVICTFLLSLFFELTQLSGLYFIYPRGYRLFDVDDLILNTLGGLLGYVISKPILSIIPGIDKINYKAREKGKVISGFRRTVSFLLDIFILFIIELITILIFKDNIYLSIILAVIYYFIIPIFLHSSTLGEKFLNIRVLDYNNNINIARLLLRRFLFVILYILIPVFICIYIFNINDDYIREFIGVIVILVMLVMYFITMIKYIFTNKDMIYEKLSKTKLVSTIK